MVPRRYPPRRRIARRCHPAAAPPRRDVAPHRQRPPLHEANGWRRRRCRAAASVTRDGYRLTATADGDVGPSIRRSRRRQAARLRVPSRGASCDISSPAGLNTFLAEPVRRGTAEPSCTSAGKACASTRACIGGLPEVGVEASRCRRARWSRLRDAAWSWLMPTTVGELPPGCFGDELVGAQPRGHRRAATGSPQNGARHSLTSRRLRAWPRTIVRLPAGRRTGASPADRPIRTGRLHLGRRVVQRRSSRANRRMIGRRPAGLRACRLRGRSGASGDRGAPRQA
jgi:hypothetical protein